MSEIKSLEEQQKSIQAELKQLENRHKILLNRKQKEERNFSPNPSRTSLN